MRSAPCRRANAGLQAAVYQTNLMQPCSTQCVHKAASDGALSNVALQADNWCEAQTEDLGDGATYTFQVSRPNGDHEHRAVRRPAQGRVVPEP